MLNTIIRTSRSSNIEGSLEAAIVRLDTFKHYTGQPVIIRYLRSDGTTVDTLFAIGIKDGVGKSCYDLVSTGGELVVNEVLFEVPDITDMVNGELYLCKNNGVWNYLSLEKDGTKKFDPNIPDPKIIKELKTGYRWFIVNSELQREDDFISTDNLEVIATGLVEDAIHPFTVDITPSEATESFVGEPIENPALHITAKFHEEEISDDNVTVSIKTQAGANITYTKEGAGIYRTEQEINKDEVLTIKISCTIDGKLKEYTKEIKYSFYYPSYYGKSEQDTEINAENYVKFLSKGDKNVELVFNLSDEVSVIALPVQYSSVKHIYDSHGLDYINEYEQRTTVISNIDYVVFYKKFPVTINNFKQVISYE